MSTLAVFIALGGSSYAAYSISGSQIKNRSIIGLKLRHNTLTGTQIREASLAAVPRAFNAARVGGLTSQDLKIKCPPDTLPAAGVCVERTARPPAAYGSAVSTCMLVGTPQAPGRRLPTYNELAAAFSAVDPAPGGELTSSVYPSSTSPGHVDALYITDKSGAVGVTPDTAAGSKAYRCVTEPLN
ncbi:hypothetical protein NBH00_01355 [Paraconexibacter antarcticus]|uniref:Uncharacterized protein n=1 Tax=Paraconexibacter antarcticus TaxID=2949664 RepID=A0ABY5DUW1_9ACTN|nr:hypothetical protein [Paraconexibacter antarcticus]UTI64867.1 hypothetical protein NBH00_01355 [Paraconexibacter antarcticus]